MEYMLVTPCDVGWLGQVGEGSVQAEQLEDDDDDDDRADDVQNRVHGGYS